jgi:hypothetical protein
METQVWLAIFVALLGIVGTLILMGVRDIIRRIMQLERSDEKMTAAILTLLIAKSDDPKAVAEALHALLVNGTGKMVGRL